MKAYALRKGAEGLFAFKLASVMRNGFSHLEVTLTGFKGKDHDREGKEHTVTEVIANDMKILSGKYQPQTGTTETA